MSSRAASLIKQANNALRSANAFNRVVYLRTTVSQGGDLLLGRYGTVTVTDTVMTPQPFVERLGRVRVPGGHAVSETVLVGSEMVMGDDYLLLASSSMITLAQLQNPQIQIVFKDATGGVEVLSVHDFETYTIDAVEVAYTVYCRSAQIQ